MPVLTTATSRHCPSIVVQLPSPTVRVEEELLLQVAYRIPFPSRIMQSAAAFRPCPAGAGAGAGQLVSRNPSRGPLLPVPARPLRVVVSAATTRALGLGRLRLSASPDDRSGQRQVSCGAAGDAVAAPSAEEGGGFMKTLWLGSLFGLWYLFNIYFNIYNKQVCVLTDAFFN